MVISSSSETRTARQPGAMDRRIHSSMLEGKPGQIFGANDFAQLGTRASIDQALSRLCKAGHIRRVSRGLYDIPRKHRLLGELLPSVHEVAKALADKESLTLQPSGAFAANLLGLSEQVPVKLSFLTDGTSRRLNIGRQTVVLKRTTPRNLATAGRVSGLVIQALRHLKKEHVDDQVIAKLNDKLSDEDKRVLREDKQHAPVWIAKLIDQIT
jgi:predicted transcriptional regulator of viral defense system